MFGLADRLKQVLDLHGHHMAPQALHCTSHVPKEVEKALAKARAALVRSSQILRSHMLRELHA